MIFDRIDKIVDDTVNFKPKNLMINENLNRIESEYIIHDKNMIG